KMSPSTIQITLSTGPATVGAVGFGLMGLTTARDGGDPVPDEQAFAVLRAALARGANFWNSAEFYGRPDPAANLRLLARYFRRYPEDAGRVVLSVKGAMVLEGGFPARPDGSPDAVRRSIRNVLALLEGTKAVDIFECARVDPSVPVEDTVAAIAEFVRSGAVRGMGLSEASAATIRRAHAVHPVAAVELEVSLASRDIWDASAGGTASIADTCAELGIPIVAYSPLARGLLTGRWTSSADVPPLMKLVSPRFEPANFERNAALVAALAAFATTKKQCTLPTLAISWLLAVGDGRRAERGNGSESKLRPVILALPGATTVERLEGNMKIVDLTEDDLSEIEAICAQHKVAGERYHPRYLEMTLR
ncbi:Pyridoxine 4-dehydrogenase, partial [Cladochytrium tenue]